HQNAAGRTIVIGREDEPADECRQADEFARDALGQGEDGGEGDDDDEAVVHPCPRSRHQLSSTHPKEGLPAVDPTLFRTLFCKKAYERKRLLFMSGTVDESTPPTVRHQRIRERTAD